MGAEDEVFLKRIKLDLYAAPEVLHNRKEKRSRSRDGLAQLLWIS
jgi:hypothetical protein